jgi:hypothetical protein
MVSFLLFASLSVEFIGPCSEKPLLQTTAQAVQSTSVGQMTIQTLEKFKIDFKGSESGLNSAFGSPTGVDAMEVISDHEMRSYGWCFEVDGKVPESYPDSISLKDVKEVRWFFGYARYLNGNWVSQCEPAYELKPEFLCH